MKKVFIAITIGLITVITSSIVFYLVVYIPEREEQKLKSQQELADRQYRQKQDEQNSRQQLFENCSIEAGKAAADLLKQKAELSDDYTFTEAANKDLFLKEDFNTYYDLCLQRYSLK